jgi:hypothetical protein
MTGPRIVSPEEARALLIHPGACCDRWDPQFGENCDVHPPRLQPDPTITERDLAHTAAVLGDALKRVESALDEANSMHDGHAKALNGLIGDCVGCLADSIRATLAGGSAEAPAW